MSRLLLPGILSQSLVKPAWEQILDAADAAGALAVYDPGNPGSLDTRDSGGDTFAVELRDGLDSWPPLKRATEAKQPIVEVSEFGQIAAVIGDGSAADMVTDEFAALVDKPLVFITILRDDNHLTASLRRAFSASNDSPPSFTSGAILAVGETGTKRGIFGGDWLNGADSDADAHVISAVMDGASSSLRVDSQVEASGNSGTRSISHFKILSWQGDGDYWDGPLGPVIILPAANLSNIEDIENLLHTLSGIPKP